MRQATARLQAAASEAVETLRELLSLKERPDVRARAALGILANATKAEELEKLGSPDGRPGAGERGAATGNGRIWPRRQAMTELERRPCQATFGMEFKQPLLARRHGGEARSGVFPRWRCYARLRQHTFPHPRRGGEATEMPCRAPDRCPPSEGRA
jgi:hypothetical protein